MQLFVNLRMATTAHLRCIGNQSIFFFENPIRYLFAELVESYQCLLYRSVTLTVPTYLSVLCETRQYRKTRHVSLEESFERNAETLST